MIPKQAFEFNLAGRPLSCRRYGSGHINETYLLTDDSGHHYILQKLNTNVFKRPELLMRNIVLVTEHLRKKSQSPREVLTLIPTFNGDSWLADSDGEFWRVYDFISDSLCLEATRTAEDFRESALAFGNFQRQLADFPAHTLSETISRFHDTPNRYKIFKEAVAADAFGRAANVQKEIDCALSHEDFAATLMKLSENGSLPLRVTHNDTKLNNVLLDSESGKALCVIDLDTVMPGLAANDFGDSIRFGASTAAEDEKDLGKVNFSLELYEAYTGGFLAAAGGSLTDCELEHLPHGAVIMTLECGLRFLTDYLLGDTYFRTDYSEHNLDRCRTQFKLAEDMLRDFDTMKKIIKKSS